MISQVAMTILIRDEADIVQEHIRYHAHQGVDYFLVTDNGSIDGTRDLLEDLRKEVALDIIDEPGRSIEQDIWTSKMALRVRDEKKADWIILSDVDEFWISKGHDLKEALSNQTNNKSLLNFFSSNSVFKCRRYNLLPDEEALAKDNYCFFNNSWKVVNPYPNNSVIPAKLKNSNCSMLTKPGPKVICTSEGLKFVNPGSHSVAHKKRATESDLIEILHFPIRKYEQFERRVKNWGESLLENTRFPAEYMVYHRKWYRMLLNGELRDEYNSYILSSSNIAKLLEENVIVRDLQIKNFFLHSNYV